MVSKRFRAGTMGILLVGAVALMLSACSTAMKDCASGFAMVSPKDGASFEVGKDVKAEATPLTATFCTFAPAVYEFSVDGHAPLTAPGSAANPSVTFGCPAAGDHTVTAVAKDANGKVLAQCAAKFKCVAPPPPAPCRPRSRRRRRRGSGPGPRRRGDEVPAGHLLRLRQVGHPGRPEGKPRQERQVAA